MEHGHYIARLSADLNAPVQYLAELRPGILPLRAGMGMLPESAASWTEDKALGYRVWPLPLAGAIARALLSPGPDGRPHTAWVIRCRCRVCRVRETLVGASGRSATRTPGTSATRTPGTSATRTPGTPLPSEVFDALQRRGLA